MMDFFYDDYADIIDGYSSSEIKYMIVDAFAEDSIIKLNKLEDVDYLRIPILNQIKYLAGLLKKEGDIKLTAKGNLPVKIVADIYAQGFIREKWVDRYLSKVWKENDILSISLTRKLLVLSGIAMKRNNKLVLTKSGGKILNNDEKLLHKILDTFGYKLNWAFFDRYSLEHIGQFGFGFSLAMLSRFGDERRPVNFYADLYLESFPGLLDPSLNNYFLESEHNARICYSLRTFERFLAFFGLINFEYGKNWNDEAFVSRTDLFDKLICIMPPKRRNNLNDKFDFQIFNN